MLKSMADGMSGERFKMRSVPQESQGEGGVQRNETAIQENAPRQNLASGLEDISKAEARRKAIVLKLGGNPTRQELLVELRTLNDSLKKLRDDRAAIQRGQLGTSSEDKAERLREVDEHIAQAEQYRDDLGLLSGEAVAMEAPQEHSVVELRAESAQDALRGERERLQMELKQAGFFAFGKKRDIEAKIREVDRKIAELINARRSQGGVDVDRRESIAAK